MFGDVELGISLPDIPDDWEWQITTSSKYDWVMLELFVPLPDHSTSLHYGPWYADDPGDVDKIAKLFVTMAEKVKSNTC